MQAVVDWFPSSKRFLVISAPTGTGKSLVSIAAQRILNKKVHTLVSTIRLQDQMKTSYKYAPVLKGRTHYDCLITPVTVDQAPCQVGFQCHKKLQCPYFMDRESAFTSDYAVFNYQLYMHQLEFNVAFAKPDLIVCDEAHLAHLELEKYISAEISQRDISKEGWRRPKDVSVEGLSDWASNYLEDATKAMKIARARVFGITGGPAGDTIKGSGSQYKYAMGEYSRMQRLVRTLSLFYQAGLDTEDGKPWISSKSGYIYQVRPVFVDRHTEYLFADIPKVVLMSATINEDDVKRLGITDYDFIEVGSNYDAERRPVYYRPVGSMSSKSESILMPKLVTEIDNIIYGHSQYGHKGIIHTVSYDRAKNICSQSKYKEKMLLHTADNKDKVIEKFKSAKSSIVLLSPSILEGEDFPDDECRYIIIPKVPYLSLGDDVVRERISIDPEWYSWKAVQDIIQGAGRGMRNQTDFCSIYILDAMFEKIAEKHWDEIPQWFKDAIQYLELKG